MHARCWRFRSYPTMMNWEHAPEKSLGSTTDTHRTHVLHKKAIGPRNEQPLEHQRQPHYLRSVGRGMRPLHGAESALDRLSLSGCHTSVCGRCSVHYWASYGGETKASIEVVFPKNHVGHSRRCVSGIRPLRENPTAPKGFWWGWAKSS